MGVPPTQRRLEAERRRSKMAEDGDLSELFEALEMEDDGKAGLSGLVRRWKWRVVVESGGFSGFSGFGLMIFLVGFDGIFFVGFFDSFASSFVVLCSGVVVDYHVLLGGRIFGT